MLQKMCTLSTNMPNPKAKCRTTPDYRGKEPVKSSQLSKSSCSRDDNLQMNITKHTQNSPKSPENDPIKKSEKTVISNWNKVEANSPGVGSSVGEKITFNLKKNRTNVLPNKLDLFE